MDVRCKVMTMCECPRCVVLCGDCAGAGAGASVGLIINPCPEYPGYRK